MAIININFNALAALLVSFTSIVSGSVVYFGNRRAKPNIAFFLLTFAIALWSFAYVIWQNTLSPETSLFWLRMLLAPAIFIPATYLYFVFEFLGIFAQKKKILATICAVFSIFFLLNFTPLFINRIETTAYYQFRPVPGPSFNIFLFAWLLCVVYSSYLLFTAYRGSEGIRRLQLRYVLIGWVIGFAGGSTNYFIFYNIPWLPLGLGNWSVLAYVLCTFYAMVKLNLFNTKVITAEILTFSIWIIAVTRFLFDRTLSERVLDGVFFIGMLLSGILIIRSALNEAEQKAQLADLNLHLEQKVREQTTEIRKAYEVEKQARVEIQMLDKAKDQFILTTQHHLRTPLTIFRGFIHKVLTNTKDSVSDANKNDLQKASAAADRMAGLINEFLDITQMEIGQTILRLQPVDLQEVIKEIYEDALQELEKKKLVFQAEFSEAAAIASLKADPGKIKIALYNLIDNAIKYTEKGTISVHADVVSHPIEHFKALRVTIKDTGIGIPPEELPQLFHLYFQRGAIAEKVYTTGRGIGLALARDIIEAHRGRISAESEGVGKGTTFTLELPL